MLPEITYGTAPGGNWRRMPFLSCDLGAEQPPAVAAVALLRDWYRRGVLPRNVMTLKTEEVITAMQQGRAALTNQPFGRIVNYNDPRASRFPGEITVANIPMMAIGSLAATAAVITSFIAWRLARPVI